MYYVGSWTLLEHVQTISYYGHIPSLPTTYVLLEGFLGCCGAITPTLSTCHKMFILTLWLIAIVDNSVLPLGAVQAYYAATHPHAHSRTHSLAVGPRVCVLCVCPSSHHVVALQGGRWGERLTCKIYHYCVITVKKLFLRV